MTPYILNLLDLAFTLNALGHGGVELNPLMQCAPVMIAYKLIGVGALCYGMEWLAGRGNTLARIGLYLAAAAFAAVDAWHVINLLLIWRCYL